MNEYGWFQKHALLLGKLSGNLITIELAARTFIELSQNKKIDEIQKRLINFKQGEWVDITPLSDPRGMSWTLDEYNRCVEPKRPGLKVDLDQIVFLRDALAHGKAFGIRGGNRGNQLRLLKMGKDKDATKTKVQITLVLDMTQEWFDEKAEFLSGEIGKIQQALGWDQADLGGYEKVMS